MTRQVVLSILIGILAVALPQPVLPQTAKDV